MDFLIRKIFKCSEELAEETGHEFFLISRNQGAEFNLVSRRDPKNGRSFLQPVMLLPLFVPAAELLPIAQEYLSCEQLRTAALREMRLNE